MSSKGPNVVSETNKHLEAGEPEPELQPGLLTLYSMRFCPFAQRTRLVLQHKRLPHQIVNVNLVRKPDWFLAKSASGKVPTLIKTDGSVLEDSLATSNYLDEANKESPLYPSDSAKRAQAEQVIAKMGSTVIPAFYQWLGSTGDEQKAAWAGFLKALGAMQDDLGGSKFFAGSDVVQMADLMIWPWFERLAPCCQMAGFQLPADQLKPLMDWMGRMEQQRAVKETRNSDSNHAEFLRTYMAKQPKYDDY